jgi:hypothetical protein
LGFYVGGQVTTFCEAGAVFGSGGLATPLAIGSGIVVGTAASKVVDAFFDYIEKKYIRW